MTTRDLGAFAQQFRGGVDKAITYVVYPTATLKALLHPLDSPAAWQVCPHGKHLSSKPTITENTSQVLLDGLAPELAIEDLLNTSAWEVEKSDVDVVVDKETGTEFQVTSTRATVGRPSPPPLDSDEVECHKYAQQPSDLSNPLLFIASLARRCPILSCDRVLPDSAALRIHIRCHYGSGSKEEELPSESKPSSSSPGNLCLKSAIPAVQPYGERAKGYLEMNNIHSWPKRPTTNEHDTTETQETGLGALQPEALKVSPAPEKRSVSPLNHMQDATLSESFLRGSQDHLRSQDISPGSPLNQMLAEVCATPASPTLYPYPDSSFVPPSEYRLDTDEATPLLFPEQLLIDSIEIDFSQQLEQWFPSSPVDEPPAILAPASETPSPTFVVTSAIQQLGLGHNEGEATGESSGRIGGNFLEEPPPKRRRQGMGILDGPEADSPTSATSMQAHVLVEPFKGNLTTTQNDTKRVAVQTSEAQAEDATSSLVAPEPSIPPDPPRRKRGRPRKVKIDPTSAEPTASQLHRPDGDTETSAETQLYLPTPPPSQEFGSKAVRISLLSVTPSSPGLPSGEVYPRESSRRTRKRVTYAESDPEEDEDDDDNVRSTKHRKGPEEEYDDKPQRRGRAKIFKCPIPGCRQTTTRLSDMERHSKSMKHQNVLFGCPFCDRWLQRHDAVTRHCKTRHGMIPEDKNYPVREG
ncbi:hypothetical protein PQX77_006403 [Marasmius sp. AFHP31]|nr:hypothetical protein PQX77_006403 [Marasmius sp. AFHP31]